MQEYQENKKDQDMTKEDISGYDQGGYKEDGVGLGFYPHLGQGGAYLR